MVTPAIEHGIEIAAGGVSLPGLLTAPARAVGLVVFAHGSGSSRLSPRNRMVAEVLHERRCATLLFDLLTVHESTDRANVFDIELLGARVSGAIAWARERPDAAGLPIACFGASTGSAAALVAAANDDDIRAVVSRGGRPDLARDALPVVTAPTLLIVGSMDTQVLELNRQARLRLGGPSELLVVDGATHLFEEPGTLEQAADAAAAWFAQWF